MNFRGGNLEKKIKLLVGDTQELFRDIITQILDFHEDMTVIDSTDDGNELIRKYFLYKPDVIILDVQLKNKNGFACFSEIRLKYPDVKALFLTDKKDINHENDCRKLGAFGFLDKNIKLKELHFAITRIFEGEYLFSTHSETVTKQLTSREKEIMQYILKKYTNKEIATELGLSIRTVESHRIHIKYKLNIESFRKL